MLGQKKNLIDKLVAEFVYYCRYNALNLSKKMKIEDRKTMNNKITKTYRKLKEINAITDTLKKGSFKFFGEKLRYHTVQYA